MSTIKMHCMSQQQIVPTLNKYTSTLCLKKEHQYIVHNFNKSGCICVTFGMEYNK